MTKKLKKMMARGVSAKRLKVGTWFNVTTVRTCRIKWFHLDCVRMSEIPIGRWLCSDCKNSSYVNQCHNYYVSPFVIIS